MLYMAYEILVFLKVLDRKGIWRLGLGGQRLLDNESDGRIILRVRLAIEKSARVSHYVEKSSRNKAVEAKQSKQAGETSGKRCIKGKRHSYQRRAGVYIAGRSARLATRQATDRVSKT